MKRFIVGIKINRSLFMILLCMNSVIIFADNIQNPISETFREQKDSVKKAKKSYPQSVVMSYNDSIAAYNDSIISYNESLIKRIEEYTGEQNTNALNAGSGNVDLNSQLMSLIEESKKTNQLLLSKSSGNTKDKEWSDLLESQRKMNETLNNQLLALQRSQQNSDERYRDQLLTQSLAYSGSSNNGNAFALTDSNRKMAEQLQQMQKENQELNRQFSKQIESQRKTNEELSRQLNSLRNDFSNPDSKDTLSKRKKSADLQKNKQTDSQATVNQQLYEQVLDQMEKQQQSNEVLNQQMFTHLEKQYKKNDSLSFQLAALRGEQYPFDKREYPGRDDHKQQKDGDRDKKDRDRDKKDQDKKDLDRNKKDQDHKQKDQDRNDKNLHSKMNMKHELSDKGMVLSGNSNVIVGNNNIIILADDEEALGRVWSLTGKKDFGRNLRNDKIYTEHFFEHFSIGLKASTLGPGIELATTISKNIHLRGGYSFINYSENFTIETKDDNLRNATNTKDYYPDYKVRGKFRFHNGHVLLDIYPMREGIFHFTGGVFLGDNKISADGRLIHPDTKQDAVLDPGLSQWPDVNFADYQVKVNNNGVIKADIELGNYVKPYFGIGLGRSVPKSKFGLKFEIGALYQGDFVIKQNGRELQKDKSKEDTFIDEKDYTKWLKFWPMINLQLIYRL